MAQKTEIVTLRLSPREARRVSAVQALTHLDKATLLRDFIEDGMRRRVLESYGEGQITAQRAADVLDISLREFLSLLEKNGLPVNWDSDLIRDYMTKQYGE
jgi:predicted HTH domain antitoxin